MFELRDLFQWERFITPSIIKIFYWLMVVLCLLVGVAGVLGGLAMMFASPIGGLISVVSSLIGMLIGYIGPVWRSHRREQKRAGKDLAKRG